MIASFVNPQLKGCLLGDGERVTDKTEAGHLVPWSRISHFFSAVLAHPYILPCEVEDRKGLVIGVIGTRAVGTGSCVARRQPVVYFSSS